MRAVIYGVEPEQDRWEWFVSVAPEADAAWWLRRGVTRLWLLGNGQPVSLGQAIERCAELRGRRMAGAGRWVDAAALLRATSFVWKEDDYEHLMRRLEGRLLLREEMESFAGAPEAWLGYVQWGALAGRLRLRHGIEREGGGRWQLWPRTGGRFRGYRCLRCGSGGKLLRLADCPVCGEACPYCEACLTMGRSRYCALAVQGLARPGVALRGAADPAFGQRWGLSPAQEEAAGAALQFLETPGSGMFLLWAVTGAGKTEMMFPLIERMLAAGRRSLIATPRRDVVLELAPRMKAAFPGERVVTLYGGSAERWDAGGITLATTHQLFRFREAFDLVVVDEVDAFPFHGDPQLAYAAERACKRAGKFVLLSATPPAHLRRAVAHGRLPHAKVCVRFHRRPLPVPRRLAVPPLRRWQGLPRALRAAVEASLRRGAQLFVFVPLIAAIPGVVRLLQGAFPDAAIGGTSSKDEARAEKVLQFRGKELRIIVTTTILERGVTVPKTDVFILDADSALFDGASLVQMAGRAGRKKEDPDGYVYFCSADWTRAQKEAIRDIREMNKLARKRGYILPC